jgi:endonuclease YncB( thermonuclease family)
MNEYKIINVAKVVDGDTVWVDADLGFYVSLRVDLRLARCNCPEIGKPGAAEATAFTTQWLTHPGLWFKSNKTDDWKRWIAEVYDINNHNLSDDLMAGGFAVPYTK